MTGPIVLAYAELRAHSASFLRGRESCLAHLLTQRLKRQRLPQVVAAELAGMHQSQLSKILRGQFRDVSEAQMWRYLVTIGYDVTITVGSRKRRGVATIRLALI